MEKKTMATIDFLTPLDKQNLLDMSLMGSGSIEAVFAYALLNNKSITDDIFGSDIKTLPIINLDVYNFYRFQTIRPASGGNVNIDFIPEAPEGVDYWIIANNFITS